MCVSPWPAFLERTLDLRRLRNAPSDNVFTTRQQPPGCHLVSGTLDSWLEYLQSTSFLARFPPKALILPVVLRPLHDLEQWGALRPISLMDK